MRARASVFGGINFGDLVKNSPIRQIKIPAKVSGYTVFCLGVVTYAGATDWVLPILLVHHAHFAPRHFLPWYGHLCWCYRLGVTHTTAAPCPLCSKTYSALVWSLMLVLQIGCYPYCCCIMPTLLQDIFCLLIGASVSEPHTCG